MGWRYRLDAALFTAGMASRLAWERLETGMAFDPTRRAMRVDPHPYYRRLRERDPFHRSRPAAGWVLTRYDDILHVLGDRTFSSDERHWSRLARYQRRKRLAGLKESYQEGRETMLRSDPPDHTRLRNLVNQAFTPRAVDRMRPRIEHVSGELLDRMARRHEKQGDAVELVRELAAPLPVVVIAEMLGVPAEDFERFRHWSDEVVRTLGDSTMEDERRSDAAVDALGAYFSAIADQRRAEPRDDDLLSALVAAEEQGDRLHANELLAILVLLLVAGNETTTKLIANSVIALLRNPDQLALLRREPKRLAGAVDELIRYDGPVQLTSRLVKEDRELRGHRLRRGQQLVLVLAAGNRDPERFADPDRLDVTREDVRRSHLGFGHGIHFCLGAQLARLEAAIALEALVTRFPDLRFADPGPSGEGAGIVWGDNTVLRGPTRLPLRI